jgi:heptosyltransferase I
MPSPANILIIKTSSLGDVIHTLPALTDAHARHPHLHFDWVVEEHFREIPAWHPAVNRVITVALRRWRHHPYRAWRSGEWRDFTRQLRQQKYDYIIDAQGLLKSACLSRWATGIRCGLDQQSAREPLASWQYHRRYFIDKQQHAVERVRQLFAKVLDYSLQSLPLDYGISPSFPNASVQAKRLIFLHGTTWHTKQLPEPMWLVLAEHALAAGFDIRVAWGNTAEWARARRIAAISPRISLIDKGNLYSFATELLHARAVIGVDTGLAHLAAALAIPSITIYGATAPQRTGTYQRGQTHILATFPCSPCFRKRCVYPEDTDIFPRCYRSLSVEALWSQVELLLQSPPTTS